MAALLTGLGYIGAALVPRLMARGESVVALENFYSTPREAIGAAGLGQVELIEGDVANASDVARAFDAAARSGTGELAVFHLAAQPSAAIAARDPELTERSNLVGARIVLEAARDHRARVIFGGSFRVYGDELIGQAVDESTPYGRVADLSHLSKIYVEQLARTIGGAFVSVRLGVTYGLSPIMKTVPEFMTVPNLFCQKAIRGEVLNVLEDRPIAFIHVDDAADALVAALDCAGDSWQVVNAAPEVATIGQVARTVQRLVQARGGWVRIQGAASAEATFSVRSRLDEAGFQARRTLAGDL
ncbi:MAG TPA: NAD(P)-dependent oxidoreductase, partial [Chloroflexota bacterium]